MNNRHHRRAKSLGGGEGRIRGIENVIMVKKHKHIAFHTLFPDPSPYAIAEELTRTWIDPAFIIMVVPR